MSRRRRCSIPLLVLALLGWGIVSGSAEVIPAFFAIGEPVGSQVYTAPRTHTASDRVDSISASSSLTIEQLKKATYVPVNRYDRSPVTLADGVYRGHPDPLSYELTLDDRFIAFGDLNQDGFHDAVAILHEWYGGGGPYTVVAALLNRQGDPIFADAISLGSQRQVTSLTIEHGTITVTAKGRTIRQTEETDRLRYALKDHALVGIKDESVLIRSRGSSTMFSVLEPIVAFEIPDNFVVKPQYERDIAQGRFNFARVSYPHAGYTDLVCLANYTFSTEGDSDKIIRQRIGGAIEICISGIDYAWHKYPYRNKYRKSANASRVVFYEEKPDTLSWRGVSVVLPIRPSADNARTHAIFITVRTGDKSVGNEVLEIFSRIKTSLKALR